MADFPEMRKKKYVIDESEAWNILCSDAVEYGFLGVCGLEGDDGYPYVVPMNFAADKETGRIYFHTTMDAQSRRNRTLAANEKVCFTVVSPDSHIAPGPEDMPACKFSMSFESVVAFGDVEEITGIEEKTKALDLIMSQKAGKHKHTGVMQQLVYVTKIYSMKVRHISGARKD